MKEYWNNRYGLEEFAYGKGPNLFIQQELPLINPKGKILFPAEGEGRNAVYASQLGWEVEAFDFSEEGKKKADQMAKEVGVTINYQVKKFLEEDYAQSEFDVIGLTYVHFPEEIKMEMHKRLDSYLKIGGYILLEAFSKEHRELSKINPKVGGPDDISMMYSIDEIKRDFPNYEWLHLSQNRMVLEEGYAHVGESDVIRFIGKKKS